MFQEVTEEENSLFLGSMNETATERRASVDHRYRAIMATLVMFRTAVNFKIDTGTDTILIKATDSHLQPKLRPVTAVQ